MKKVFVTGHQGYIGAHLVPLLQQRGYRVTGCDIGLFAGCEWAPLAAADTTLARDTRTLTAADIAGHDCVIHLAAISNDPMGDMNHALTLAVNRDASIHLARLCKQTGVPRYLFASSCAMYGKGDKLDLTEADALNPLTAYAKSKIDTEQAVRALADDDFSPAFLRNATAYGDSPALRIDLVVNNLLASALAYGEIRIKSDGEPWRPLVHCKDIARALVAFMEAPRARIHNQAVNIGGNAENYQVKDVAALVKKLIPTAAIAFTGEIGEDPRNYRVNFDHLATVLPDFRLEYPLEKGMTELHAAMTRFGFGAAHFESDRFIRLRTLASKMHLLTPQ